MLSVFRDDKAADDIDSFEKQSVIFPTVNCHCDASGSKAMKSEAPRFRLGRK